jgi:alkanesulfonate monooxygenase SsuD/methylene tetrahydromethanopterin reductase-like flavin-dependent oxidoreductase (luciferase family)
MAAVNDTGLIKIEGAPSLSWAAAWRPKITGQPCGDRHLVRQVGPLVMIAVIDGAGSGPRAANAASACQDALAAKADPLVLAGCFAAAHHACRETSGVALGVALIEPATGGLTWGAVGDIDGLLIRHAPAGQSRREAILQCGGMVGLRLPPVLGQTHQISTGDILIMVSDGIHPRYRGPTLLCGSPDTCAAELLSEYGRAQDDAIVLAARIGCHP